MKTIILFLLIGLSFCDEDTPSVLEPVKCVTKIVGNAKETLETFGNVFCDYQKAKYSKKDSHSEEESSYSDSKEEDEEKCEEICRSMEIKLKDLKCSEEEIEELMKGVGGKLACTAASVSDQLDHLFGKLHLPIQLGNTLCKLLDPRAIAKCAKRLSKNIKKLPKKLIEDLKMFACRNDTLGESVHQVVENLKKAGCGILHINAKDGDILGEALKKFTLKSLKKCKIIGSVKGLICSVIDLLEPVAEEVGDVVDAVGV